MTLHFVNDPFQVRMETQFVGRFDMYGISCLIVVSNSVRIRFEFELVNGELDTDGVDREQIESIVESEFCKHLPIDRLQEPCLVLLVLFQGKNPHNH